MVYGEEFFYGGAGISSCPPVKSQPTATLLVLKIQALKRRPNICSNTLYCAVCEPSLYMIMVHVKLWTAHCFYPFIFGLLRLNGLGTQLFLRGTFVLGRLQYVPQCMHVFTGRDDARTSRHSGGTGKYRGDRGDLYGLPVLTWRDNI